MFTGVYTGYGLVVRTEKGAIVDERINTDALLAASNASMGSYKNWLEKEGLDSFNAGSGYANQFIRLFPVNADQTESILVILPPMDGRIGVRENNVVDLEEPEEDRVSVQKLMSAPHGFPTKRYVVTMDGNFHRIEETVWQNILIRYYNSGVEGSQEVTEFARKFGFFDGQHMIDSVRLSVAPEIFHFLDWAKFFKEELTIAKLEPMVVTVKKVSESFIATA